MIKITFMGAGSTVFLRNVLGDCIYTDALKGMEIALYDIDGQRLEQSAAILEAINKGNGCPASIRSYLGAENRRKALSGADFVINAIQVGGYDPCTIHQISRSLKIRPAPDHRRYTFWHRRHHAHRAPSPVLEDSARDMQAVCPNAWFLNYTNPMSMLTGYMLRFTGVKNAGPVSQRTDVQQNPDGRHRHERPSGGTPSSPASITWLAAGHLRPG